MELSENSLVLDRVQAVVSKYRNTANDLPIEVEQVRQEDYGYDTFTVDLRTHDDYETILYNLQDDLVETLNPQEVFNVFYLHCPGFLFEVVVHELNQVAQ